MHLEVIGDPQVQVWVGVAAAGLMASMSTCSRSLTIASVMRADDFANDHPVGQ
jgi:hypothetical protein